MFWLGGKLEGKISRMGVRAGVSGMGRWFCCFGFRYRLRHLEHGGVGFRVRVRSMRDGRNVD